MSGRFDPFLQEELEVIFHADIRYCDHYAVLGKTGLRRNEFVALQRRDFRQDEKTGGYYLMIERSYDMKTREMRVTKGKNKRRVDLWPDTAETIGHRLYQPGRPEDFIFPGEDGGMLYPTTLTHDFPHAVKALGLRRRNLHQLRHTHATILLSSMGWSVVDVQVRLGHNKPSTTLNYYAHYIPGNQARLIAQSVVAEPQSWRPAAPVPRPNRGKLSLSGRLWTRTTDPSLIRTVL